MPLVQNVDPQQIRTPLSPLLRSFAASPYKIAPERENELERIVEDAHLRIWLDSTVETFDVDISAMMQRIKFPLSALERLWGYAYSYSLFFDLYQPQTQGTLIELHGSPQLEAARRLLVWAYEAELSGTHAPWPDDAPRPDFPNGDDRITTTNQIFLMMTGFFLLHEVAHLVLGHCAEPSASAEESIECEFAADGWAANWVLSEWERYNPQEEIFIQRSVGIAFALATIGGIEIHGTHGGERDHPTSPARLLAFLDRWLPEPQCGSLPKKFTAWKVGPAILHAHFLKLGQAANLRESYPSFRQYLMEAQSFF